ncbi:helix-turn-helix domain-containing protein [Sphaerisporangium sp. NPDC005288]|uniref:helix-turn-helix domain-containing protein n=1 Tax=Sphaerisporangium sp. NPDC005288 TaxID=3155114 RepID=UPI0033B53977
MSIAVMNWVWQHSPTSGNQRLVLLALADACSRDDGTGCWPSVATVARKANISPRSVRRILGELAAAGHLQVRRGAGPHGTNGYAIVMHSPTPAPPAPVEIVFEPVYESVETVDNRAAPGQPVTPDKVSGVTPVAARGDTGDRGGVTRLSPNPPKNHQEPPPPPRERPTAKRGRSAAGRTPARSDGYSSRPLCWPEGGGGEAETRDPQPGSPQETCANPIEVFIAELGPDWPLSARQVDRLTPAVAAALADGWSSAALAEHVGANTAGVRNPYAVLTARLNELPDPVRLPPPRISPADRSVAEAVTPACPHGDPRPGGCALCRRGITHLESA